MNLKKIFNSFSVGIQNFCSKTSLHGFSYLVNRSLAISDRLLWSVIIAIQIFFCYRYATYIFNKRNSNPVLMAYDTKATLASEVS